ncbi:MAG: hypothetical protein C5B50_04445 [Verrucomicrobia bacterium]|nr:MAG: hypothetical protein C5B50_04445 [Verrucomicrobiota bacterium]
MGERFGDGLHKVYGNLSCTETFRESVQLGLMLCFIFFCPWEEKLEASTRYFSPPISLQPAQGRLPHTRKALFVHLLLQQVRGTITAEESG